MNTKPLDELFQQFFNTAKQNLQKDGLLVPYVFLLGGTANEPRIDTAIQMRFKTDADKDELAKEIEELIRTKGVWGYFMVHEAWMLDKDDFPDEALPNVQPSTHPKRREAAFVSLFTYDYHRGAAALFKRQGDKIIFTKEISIQPDIKLAGRFAGMLPPMN